MSRLSIPPSLASRRVLGEPWAQWLDGLPARYTDVTREWELTPAGDPWHGYCSVVVPVRTSAGEPAALKLGLPDEESATEHLALRRWGGDGAVRLLRADPRRQALLLERLGVDDLTTLSDLAACDVVAASYSRLHVPAGAQFARLSDRVAETRRRLTALPRQAPIPPRLVAQAISIADELGSEESTDATLIHSDLHYANVLTGAREPWLVIDPKPLAGDPHYEPAPMLWNRWDELAGDIRGGVRRRFHALVDGAGLTERRARDWVVFRMIQNALWRVTDPAAGHRLTPSDAFVTMCVAVAKAVQD